MVHFFLCNIHLLLTPYLSQALDTTGSFTFVVTIFALKLENHYVVIMTGRENDAANTDLVKMTPFQICNVPRLKMSIT